MSTMFMIMMRKRYKKKIPKSKILLTGLLIFLTMSTLALAAPVSHPALLFKDISETPGYQHRTESPWSGWEKNILSSSNRSLSKDFSDPNWNKNNGLSERAERARDLALAYQITKNPAYAKKAREALLNLDVGDSSGKTNKARALKDYSLSYDWVQKYLDISSEKIIRDKLATLADTVYKELNDDGNTPDYVTFADYHGQAYPSVGVAAVALYDYTNPNNLPISSTPADWIKVGTEYLFVNDKLHSYDRSLFSFGFDSSGKHLNGAYKSYVISDFVWWFQVYSYFYNKNIFNEYPIAKNAFTSEIWENMPNYYNNNFITNGNIGMSYHKGIINLLDNENKSYALNHVAKIENSDLLPYSYNRDYTDSALLYIVYGDYSSVQKKRPSSWTSHLDKNSQYQVFRQNWNEDSDWLSFITWNVDTGSNRDMGHHDQMSMEYYGKGDLLLADAGENKYVLDEYYGQYEVHHNTISIENPRKPFSLSSWADSNARGIPKGSTSGLITPAPIENLIQSKSMEMVGSKVTINQVIDDRWSLRQTISSPIQYKREIMYPNKDYFIVVDRLEGSEPWIYRNIFRPTSLTITPSSGTTEPEVGHVNGDLTIGSTPYNWLSLPYKDEKTTGIYTSSIKWRTTNPYGKKVELNLFSTPSSEIKVTKHVGRVAGYTKQSEVFSPIIYFRTKAVKELYRITVLLPKYSAENEKIPQELPVNGNGNALKVSSSNYEDFIYSGKGDSSFASISTDAETLYLRKTAGNIEYTLINGSKVLYAGKPLISLSKKVDYFTLTKEQGKTVFKIKGSGLVGITLYQMDSSVDYQIKRDGAYYTNWVLNNNIIIITTKLSDHVFEIIPGNSQIPTPTPTPKPTPIPTLTPAPTPKPTLTPAPTPKPAPSGSIIKVDFESGLDGWTASGLWHKTGNRYSSSSNSFWYGNENTKNYDTGSRNSGTLVSPEISLANTQNPVLFFMSWYHTEFNVNYDKKLVQISVDNGPWTDLEQITHTQKSWVKEQIDLSSYAGNKIKIRFLFDTMDDKYNKYEGWYIDDVEIKEV